LAEEDPKQLSVSCAVVGIIWISILSWAGFSRLPSATNLNLRTWWKQNTESWCSRAGQGAEVNFTSMAGDYSGENETQECLSIITGPFSKSSISLKMMQGRP
jgi:hypothetical protein